MTVQTDIADFRTDNACDTTQLPDSTALRYYNDVRDIVIDRIVAEKEDFFYNEMSVDLTIGKREYVLPKRGDLAEDGVTVLDGIKKIKEIGVKFKTTDSQYTKLLAKNTNVLVSDLLSYSSTSVSNAFYVVSDNSVFLYPTPTEDVNAGMMIYAIMQPKKLALSDSETLSDSIKKVILLGLAQRWFTSQHMYDKSASAQTYFDKELSRMAISLSSRMQGVKQVNLPSLKQYK